MKYFEHTIVLKISEREENNILSDNNRNLYQIYKRNKVKGKINPQAR